MITKIIHTVNVVKSIVREQAKKLTRSSKWSKVRKEKLKSNPYCAACGSTKFLQVHHCVPFHLKPELELDPKNLIVLCMSKNECHLLLGHGNNFKKYNPYLSVDIKNLKAGTLSMAAARVVSKRSAIFLPVNIKPE